MRSSSPARVAVVAGALALASVLGTEARASASGMFDRSGRTFGRTCANCHSGGTPGSVVTFTLTPLNADLPPFGVGYVPGALYSVAVSITGGPAVRNGFNWDSDAGATRVTGSGVRKNTNPNRTAEMTHNSVGTNQNTWTFEWTAPADRRTAQFWLMGNSTNGNRGTSGDTPTSPVRLSATAAPPEVLARIGNVNDAAGDPVPVLLVNGSRGDDLRVVTVATGGPSMEIAIASYPGAPSAIPYVIYALRRANREGDAATIPGIGLTAFAFPVSGGAPVVVANTLAHERQLGAPRVRGTPLGPGPILTLPRIPPSVAGASITLQGLVPDATAPSGGSVTNGVVVTFF